MPDHEEAVREALLLQLRVQVGEILRSTDPELSLEGAEAELVDIACEYSDAIRASERAKYAALVEAVRRLPGMGEHVTDTIPPWSDVHAALAALQSKEGTNAV